MHHYQILVNDVRNLPIRKISQLSQQPFITLVDKILVAKALGEETSEWKRRIEELVYQLYGLTEEEIAVIERG
jgi:adenine-specific DNA-methyltransferase